MTDLTVFNYADTEIRAIVIAGEPWFVAADICPLLGYQHTPSAIRRLDDDEYQQVEFSLVAPNVRTTDGPPRRPVTAVSEGGLYSLILWSHKPEAKAFKRWITHDVLPAIRTTGRYGADPRPSVSDTNLRALINDLEAKQSAAATAARGHLGVISAMGDCVSAATREMLAQHVWAEYADAVGLNPTKDRFHQVPATAGSNYQHEPDLVEQWLADVCEPYGPGTQAALLHAAFIDWCRSRGIEAAAQPTASRLGRRLTALGYPPRRSSVGRRFRPLRAVRDT